MVTFRMPMPGVAAIALALTGILSAGDAAAQLREQKYGTLAGWNITAIFQGPVLGYCAATTRSGGAQARIGFDGTEWVVGGPSASSPVTGRISIDGISEIQDFESLGDGWVFTKFSTPAVQMLRQGNRLGLGIGGPEVTFSLSGSAAAMLKLDECVRRGGAAPFQAPQQPLVQQQPFGQQPPQPFGQQPQAQVQPQPRQNAGGGGGGGSAGTCPDGSSRLPITQLCPSEAASMYMSGGGTLTLPLPDCSWTVNETQIVSDVLLYQASNCNGQVSKLEFSGGARLSMLTSSGVDVTIASADPNDPQAGILSTARQDFPNTPLAAQCSVRPYNEGGMTDSYIVDISEAEVARLSADGPYMGSCGRFGVSDETSFWRVFGGFSWFVAMGQDAYHPVDPSSMTLLGPDGQGGWKVLY